MSRTEFDAAHCTIDEINKIRNPTPAHSISTINLKFSATLIMSHDLIQMQHRKANACQIVDNSPTNTHV